MKGSISSQLLRCICAIALLCGAPALSAAPDGDGELEWKLKAAFLINFARFTEWPADKFASANSAIDFCVRDNPPLASALADALDGKAIKGRALALRSVPPAGDMRPCHVAYVGGSSVEPIAASLSTLAGSSALSVYEGDKRLSGGAIRLFLDDHKVRFEVDLGVTERERLSLSSRLLSVARIVQQ